MRRWLVALSPLPLLLVGMAAPAFAAELLMFETRSCPWCLRWKQEVGVAYPNTPEGKRAPVRSVDLHAGSPPGVVLDKPVQFSPTFVLVGEDGREVGRITGYPGADFFWGLFGDLARKLPPKASG
jgi:hypothetical protein